MLWDGLGFFGTDTHKLGRNAGKKVGWCTKFENIAWVVTTSLWLICAVWILKSKSAKLGHQKTNTLQLESEPEYNYNVRKSFNFHFVHWLNVD